MISYPRFHPRLEPVVDEDGHWYSGLPEEAWEIANKLPLKEQPPAYRPGPSFAGRTCGILFASQHNCSFGKSFLADVRAYLVLVLTYLSDSGLSTTVTRHFALARRFCCRALFFGMIIFRLLDWRNDYFVITNKHISHREFELRTFRTQLNKIPVSQVQSVTVERPTFSANLFNIGSVRITTASSVGTILFNGIDDPGEIEDVLNKLRRRVQAMDAAVAQTRMRQSVTSHFQLGSEMRPIVDEEELFAGTDLLAARPNSGFWDSASRLFEWRMEDGPVITYRRNYLILLWEFLPPILVMMLIVGLGIAVNSYVGISGTLFYAFFVVLMLADMMWILWRYENWRNDIFQLTDRDVIDIDRKPFGFGESRKQAPLRNIQNVRAERPGFFATLFDYGDVNIETAGVDSDIDCI